MNMRKAFIRSIAESLYDDTPRLIFADWLDEQGEPDQAEFIRIQCELEPMRDQYEIDRAAQLHLREEELLSKHKHSWLGRGMKGWDRWKVDGATAEFRRGFVDTVSMPVRTFLAQGSEARRLHPTIRRVVLFRVNGSCEQLATDPALSGLAELELAGWYSDLEAEAIALSPHLDQLQVLELWLGRSDGLTDTRLIQIMAGSKAWPRLRKLTLLNANDANERSKRRLVTLANKVAGRKVAVYCRGWPKLFPFAADFWYTFPGYLPDGRMAMAIENHQTTPPSLCVITFDRKGKQTDDKINVAIPDDLLAIPVSEWYQPKERMKQHLIETIGFRPGFIRIQDCRFHVDDEYNRPVWEEFSTNSDVEQFGVPDRDDEESWSESPCGFAGDYRQRLRNHEYVFGWDRYADKCGRVHST